MENNKLYYFSYGMNCDPEIMAMHDYCVAIGSAILSGYHLSFNFHANIEPGKKMMGVLWEIDQKTLKRLDFQEEYPIYYTRKTVNVLCCNNTYTAHTYIMNAIPRFSSNVFPTQQYIKHMVNGYNKFGIPCKQINDALTIRSKTCNAI